MTDAVKTLKEWTDAAHKIVFFGGAGVSTESGIPDFRSTGGLYHQEWSYPPETILSHTFYKSNPEEFFRFYRAKMLCPEAKPNAAHKKLAQWEQEGRLLAVVTQNIDGLHQAAGSRNVYELHGSVHRNHCERCGKFYSLDHILHTTGVPRCACGGIIKLVDIAPECDVRGDFVEKASKLCTVSIAHTATDYDGAVDAFKKGVTHATHLYNAMSGLAHRAPGVVGAVFDNENVCGELICDGIHIHPAVVRTTFKLMPERVCVISDAMRLSGVEDGGQGMLGVNMVTVKDGKATLPDGTIAGSVTNLHAELKNLVSWGIPLETAVRAMTLTPAKEIGMENEIGSLAPGKRADLVVLDENLEIVAVYH